MGKNIKRTSAAHPASSIGTVLKCDMHSHLIPGIDDGAKTMDDAVTLIREFHNMGYKKLFTTPHVLADSFQNSSEKILAGLEHVRVALKIENIPIEIHAAAEYYADYDFPKKIEQGNLLTFGKNYLLFEISFLNPPENLHALIFQMQTKGYRPVLAHPERYLFWFKKHETYQRLKETGVLFQLNMGSLTGYYSPPAKQIARWLIKENLIDFAGSDCHRAEHLDLIRKVTEDKFFWQLVESGKLLNNTL